MKYDLCIIGGAGHVGLPLGVAFANKRIKTILFDIHREGLKQIADGIFPFKEKGGDEALRAALKKKKLFVSHNPASIGESEFALLVIGTPVDKHLNPDFDGMTRFLDAHNVHFKDGQILILRSTVYPGATERIQRYFHDRRKKVDVVFCPERIAQGKALEEIYALPQIISGFNAEAIRRVSDLFRVIAPRVIVASQPIEAELAKLFSNAWRYIQFAVANQFYMITEEHGLDYGKIYDAMVQDYERNKDLPRPGFAAGPCLFKDTMQLAAFNNNTFFLGHAAMLVNEGLPNFIVRLLKRRFTHLRDTANENERSVARLANINFAETLAKSLGADDLKHKTVGILGMAFKADSDDSRDSLSYKLRKIVEVECKNVLCHDAHIKDPSFSPLAEVLQKSDIIILAAPHREYKKIQPNKYPHKYFVDIWNFWNTGQNSSAYQ